MIWMSQDARETESEKRIRNTSNKPCGVEIVTSQIKPYQITHFYIPLRNHRWIFPVKAKHRRILLNSNISRGEKLHEVWIIVEGSRSRKLDFPNMCNLFQKYITIICSPKLLIHFSCFNFGRRRGFLPPGAYAFLTSFVYVPVSTVFNQTWWIM